ncbi:hypothetical protein BKA65DRAFT_389384, partial [Rhexocercosporidium sp. MPI-PUGE-AT-0058]
LPQTIVDTVVTTWRLEIRFLWIGSQCIIQDDNHDKVIEISCMPQIYGNACLTILASRSSSVTEGFLHERVISNDILCAKLAVKVFDQTAKIAHLIPQRKNVELEPLYRRAWALQERLLSSRKLSFGSLQTRWFCREMDDNTSLKDDSRDGWTFRERKGWEELERFELLGHWIKIDSQTADELSTQWYFLIDTYTSCEMTFEGDRLPAISAIAQRLAPRLGDYHAGLWGRNLLSQLMWTRVNKSKLAKDATPSWTWATAVGHCRYTDNDLTIPAATMLAMLAMTAATAFPTKISGAASAVTLGMSVTATAQAMETVTPCFILATLRCWFTLLKY